MHATSRASRWMRVAVIATITTVAFCLLAPIAADGAQAAMITKCPSAGSLKSAAGTSLTIRSNKIVAGVVLCDYTHALSAIKQDSVSIAVDPMQYSDAAFAGVVATYAKDLNAPLKKLSGIGDEAWEYTEPDAKTSPNGIATTTVTIVVGKREVTVGANIPAKNVLAVAKQVS
jgi:hypothetical protein